MQKTDSVAFFGRQHTMETTCTDDAMFFDEFMHDDKGPADVDMDDKPMNKQQTFATLSPMRKIEHLEDCDVADVFLSPNTDQNIVTQATSPADDSDFASDSSDDENGRFVTRVMRKVPSKMH